MCQAAVPTEPHGIFVDKSAAPNMEDFPSLGDLERRLQDVDRAWLESQAAAHRRCCRVTENNDIVFDVFDDDDDDSDLASFLDGTRLSVTADEMCCTDTNDVLQIRQRLAVAFGKAEAGLVQEHRDFWRSNAPVSCQRFIPWIIQ